MQIRTQILVGRDLLQVVNLAHLGVHLQAVLRKRLAQNPHAGGHVGAGVGGGALVGGPGLVVIGHGLSVEVGALAAVVTVVTAVQGAGLGLGGHVEGVLVLFAGLIVSALDHAGVVGVDLLNGFVTGVVHVEEVVVDQGPVVYLDIVLGVGIHGAGQLMGLFIVGGLLIVGQGVELAQDLIAGIIIYVVALIILGSRVTLLVEARDRGELEAGGHGHALHGIAVLVHLIEAVGTIRGNVDEAVVLALLQGQGDLSGGVEVALVDHAVAFSVPLVVGAGIVLVVIPVLADTRFQFDALVLTRIPALIEGVGVAVGIQDPALDGELLVAVNDIAVGVRHDLADINTALDRVDAAQSLVRIAVSPILGLAVEFHGVDFFLIELIVVIHLGLSEGELVALLQNLGVTYGVAILIRLTGGNAGSHVQGKGPVVVVVQEDMRADSAVALGHGILLIFTGVGYAVLQNESDRINTVLAAGQVILPHLLDGEGHGGQVEIRNVAVNRIDGDRLGIGDRHHLAGLGGLLIRGIDFIGVSYQSVLLGIGIGDLHNLSTLLLGQRRIGLGRGDGFDDVAVFIEDPAVVDGGNQVQSLLAGPDAEGDHVGHVVFHLEVRAHVPLDSAGILVIGRLAAFLSSHLLQGPLGLVFVVGAVLVALSAVAVVGEALGVHLVQDLHVHIGQVGNAVVEAHVAEAQGSGDGAGDILKGLIQRICICC